MEFRTYEDWDCDWMLIVATGKYLCRGLCLTSHWFEVKAEDVPAEAKAGLAK